MIWMKKPSKSNIKKEKYSDDFVLHPQIFYVIPRRASSEAPRDEFFTKEQMTQNENRSLIDHSIVWMIYEIFTWSDFDESVR